MLLKTCVQRMGSDTCARALRTQIAGARALCTQVAETHPQQVREVLVPLIEKKLDGFKLWFFANKDKLEAQERGEACPHHEDPDNCPSKNDASHSCPFTKGKEALNTTWTAEECDGAEEKMAAYKTKAEHQLQLLEHALGPYARGERNVFSVPLRLTTSQKAVNVDSFDALLSIYHSEFSTRHGSDPQGWGSDRGAQQLVQELTSKFLQAAKPDFREEPTESKSRE
jgi:hypothetical protein